MDTLVNDQELPPMPNENQSNNDQNPPRVEPEASSNQQAAEFNSHPEPGLPLQNLEQEEDDIQMADIFSEEQYIRETKEDADSVTLPNSVRSGLSIDQTPNQQKSV